MECTPGSCLDATQSIAYSAATVLLLNLWGTQRTGMLVDPATTLADVENCLAVMRLWEPTYVSSLACGCLSMTKSYFFRSRLAMHFQCVHKH
jgi:hypothetical protein